MSNAPLPPVVIQPSAGGTATAVVNAGETANYALTLAADSGFLGAVTVSCTGAPPGSRCTPTPATVVIGAKAVPLFVSVRTTAPAAAAGGSRSAPIWPLLLVLCLPIGLAMRRRGGVAVRGAIGITWIMLLAGCGGTPLAYTVPAPATLAGNYALTVIASSNNATVGSVQLELTVR